MKKITTIVGARPQFIKVAAVSRAIKRHNLEAKGNSQIHEVLVHTGQHFDANMSDIFFDQLQISRPNYFLGINSLSHGAMTGQMLTEIEKILIQEKPDTVLVYGDTNSTLAGALAAAKLHISVAHVEAGLRSYNRLMPEETNRVLTDHVSSLLFCPTETAVQNLQNEGIKNRVINVGDVMFDAFLFSQEQAKTNSEIMNRLNLNERKFCLITVHREENTNDSVKLGRLFDVFSEIADNECEIVIPLHPRTKKKLHEIRDYSSTNPFLKIIKPVSYFDMIILEMNAQIILTDSGGVQKEAYFANRPCITLREETEWSETINSGHNILVGTNRDLIINAFRTRMTSNFDFRKGLFGDGNASEKIIHNILSTG